MPLTVKVNYSQEFHYLKFIYPQIVKNDIGDVVFSTEDDNHLGRCLTLKKSLDGYNLWCKDGLVAFLIEMEYFSESKMKLEKIKKSELFISDIFRLVAMLRVGARFSIESDSDTGFLTDYLREVPVNRLIKALDYNDRFIYRILKLLKVGLDKSIHGSLNKTYLKHITDVLTRFNKLRFKTEYVLSESMRDSLLELLLYFN